MKIAVELGWHSGSRSDETLYPAHRPLHLLDIEWIRYDFNRHLTIAAAEHPALAVVPDVLTVAGLPLALAQAAELAPHCDALCIVPKCRVIHQLPREVAGKPIVLGYSVPSKYGATGLGLWEFKGWPVHLLGGTPLRQLTAAGYMDVVSADGNMAQKLAHRGLVFGTRGECGPFDRYEPRIDGKNQPGMPARAFAESLRNIAVLWRGAGFSLEERKAA